MSPSGRAPGEDVVAPGPAAPPSTARRPSALEPARPRAGATHAKVDPEAGLRRRYEAYLRSQAAALPRLLPREAVRPLYREAVARARSRGEPVGEDPMATLVAWCRELLPLPPFEVWREDFLAHRDEHLAEPDAGSLPAPAEPVLVDVRSFEAAGREWTASLSLRADPLGTWRGRITFRASPDGPAHPTAEIFAEPDPAEIRARFADFGASTLEAFLRSVLPG